jgi:hypothetical protein
MMARPAQSLSPAITPEQHRRKLLKLMRERSAMIRTSESDLRRAHEAEARTIALADSVGATDIDIAVATGLSLVRVRAIRAFAQARTGGSGTSN